MHFAATRALRRLKGTDTIPQQDSNGNLAVKLLRTFAAQTEALQRYFYVACTRARDHLLVSGVNPVSEFLDDFVKGTE
jgi:ATP-dependent exoDNAse (exonuclease V) beta subunit